MSTAYKRKTRDYWEIQGNSGHGWETECNEETWEDAHAQLKVYRANVTYPVRTVKRRERITEDNAV